jgi:hypothetical protein
VQSGPPVRRSKSRMKALVGCCCHFPMNSALSQSQVLKRSNSCGFIFRGSVVHPSFVYRRQLRASLPPRPWTPKRRG